MKILVNFLTGEDGHKWHEEVQQQDPCSSRSALEEGGTGSYEVQQNSVRDDSGPRRRVMHTLWPDYGGGECVEDERWRD